MKNQHTKPLRALRQTIGRNIHTVRRSKKITLEKLSRKTNIPCKKLDGYEIGKYELCLSHLVPIAAALDVDISYLIQRAR
ncbi:MAG: helix-turn-helix domain-containing protein [Alphaproteobacteria bacterium]